MSDLLYLHKSGKIDNDQTGEQPINMHQLRKALFPQLNQFEFENLDNMVQWVFGCTQVLNGALIPVYENDDGGGSSDHFDKPKGRQLMLPERLQRLVEKLGTSQDRERELFKKHVEQRTKIETIEKLLDKERESRIELQDEYDKLLKKVKRLENSENVARRKLKNLQGKQK